MAEMEARIDERSRHVLRPCSRVWTFQRITRLRCVPEGRYDRGLVRSACLASSPNPPPRRRRPSSSIGDRGGLLGGKKDEWRKQKASDGSFALTTRKTAENEGRGGLGTRR